MSETEREELDQAARWVPVDACTLPTAERPLRVAEFDALFRAALLGQQRLEPGWLRLLLTPTERVEATVRELIGRESTCCSFFDFQIVAMEGELGVDVRVPEARVDVLDGIARQAETARGQTGSRS